MEGIDEPLRARAAGHAQPLARSRRDRVIEEVLEDWSKETGVDSDEDAKALKSQVYSTMSMPTGVEQYSSSKPFSIMSWALAHALVCAAE